MLRVFAIATLVLVALIGLAVLASAPVGDPTATTSPVAPAPEPDAPRGRDRVTPAIAEPSSEPECSEAESAPAPEPPAVPTETLEIHVVGPDGQPAQGATVELSTWTGKTVSGDVEGAPGRAVFQFPTGPQEVLRFARALGPGGLVSPWVRLDGKMGRAPTYTGPPLALGAGVPVVVLAVDARNSAPLAGAAVEVRVSESPHIASQVPPTRGVTDAEGRVGPVLFPQSRHVRAAVACPGYAAAEEGAGLAEAGAPVLVRVALEPAGALTVLVLAPDGSAVAGARVLVVGADHSYMDIEALLLATPDALTEALGFVEGVTDSAGRVVVDRLVADGAYSVVAAADGWAPSVLSPTVALGAASADVSTFDLVVSHLRALGRIEASVVGPDDRAVEGATVRLAPRFRWGGSPTAEVVDGAHVFEGLTPGEATLIVEAEGYPPNVHEVDVDSGETARPVVRLAAPVAISGVVVDERGLPVPYATVSPFPVDGQGWAPSVRYSKTTCDDSGTFHLAGLAPLRYTLSVSATNHRDAGTTDAAPVTAPAVGVTLRMMRMATVRMRLVVPDGVAAPRTVSYSGGAGSGAWNFRDGRVSLSGVSEGDHTLRVRADGFTVSPLTFHAAPGEIVDLGDVFLDVGVPLRGHVRTPSGDPIPRAKVQLDQTYSLGDTRTWTDAQGRFEIPHASRDGNRLRVEADGFVSVYPEISGDPSAGDVTVTLPRGAVLRVRVRAADGSAAFGTDVRVRAAADPSGTRLHTDQSGFASVRLVAGEYQVRVNSLSFRDPVTVTLIEGGPDVTATLEVRSP